MKLLLMDSETGGLDTSYSILTLYMAIYDLNMNKMGELDLKIKPNDSVFKVSEEALMVNGIDLEEHKTVAIPEMEATKEVIAFLERHSADGQQKLFPFGQNVEFDVNFIKAKLIPQKTWNKYCTYQNLDTIALATFLKLLNLLPHELSNSLGALAEYFGILAPGLHDAKIDCMTTVAITKRMIKLVQKGSI